VKWNISRLGNPGKTKNSGCEPYRFNEKHSQPERAAPGWQGSTAQGGAPISSADRAGRAGCARRNSRHPSAQRIADSAAVSHGFETLSALINTHVSNAVQIFDQG
jgi:hypothetical protein